MAPVNWLDSAVPKEVASVPALTPHDLLPLAALVESKPRPYQAELLVWVLLDFQLSQDSLVYLPTGSGKTLVGALVTSAMAVANPKKRTAFVVDKVPLLHQQAEYFRRQTQLRVAEICGDTPNREQVVKQPFDVLVITAQTFANLLAQGSVSADQFSLVVLDEVHHCTGAHPFVAVLQRLRLCTYLTRPRVLGLTASPAGAPTEASTGAALTKLEGELGTGVRTRTPCLHRDSLEEVMKVPQHVWVSVEETDTMRVFESEAASVLGSLEEAVAAALSCQSLLRSADSRLSGWQALQGYAEQQCQALLPFVRLAVRLAEAAEVSHRLGDAHGANFLGDAGTTALLSSIDIGWDVKSSVRQLLNWSGGDAPHFSRIVSLLRREAEQRRGEFRAVVFVATRAMARLLASVLQERLRDMNLGVEWLVGRGQGDTCDQGALLERFRAGDVRLLVATSVAEEGLDVAECSVAVRMHGVRSFAAHVQSRGRVRAPRGTYALVGTGQEQEAFQRLQRAEEALRCVMEARMDSAPNELREQVARCTEQLLEGERAHASASRSATLDTGASQDVVCVVAHGLRGADSDDALRAFAGLGLVVGCVCEGPNLSLPDRLRPVGHSAMVQLQLTPIPAVRRREKLAELARLLPPGTWMRDAAPVRDRVIQSKAALILEAGSFLSSGTFAPQAVFSPAEVKLGPKQQSIDFRVAQDCSMSGDLLTRGLKASLSLASVADAVLVDPGATTVFVPVTEPPKFWQLETWGNSRSREERRCMPSELFGSSFVYAFRFSSLQEAEPLLACLGSVGVHVCYARIKRVEHQLPMPRYPMPAEQDVFDMTEDAFHWAELCDTQPSKATVHSTQILRLIRALSGHSIVQDPSIDFGVIYGLLCALGEDPMLVSSVLNKELLVKLCSWPAQLARSAAAQLVPLLRGRLFVDAVAVLEAWETGFCQRKDHQVMVPKHHVLVRAATVTPTRLIFHAEEEMLSNRVLAEFGEPQAHTAEQFLRVQFRDEDGSELVGQALTPRIRSVFEEGIQILGRHFKYLHWSQSQMRSAALWLYASDGRYTCEQIRMWPFRFPEKAPKAPSKYASRLALFFSSSVPTVAIRWSDVTKIDDVECDDGKGGKYCFTDGAGLIRQDVAEEVARHLGCKAVPSAFQIRYGGAKGVVVAYPGPMHPSGRFTCSSKLMLRPSMIKFESLNDSFEVVNWSRHSPAVLNQQIILLLAARGVRPGVFLELQEQALLDASRIVADPKRAALRLAGVYTGACRVEQLELGCIDVLNEPFFASLLRFLYRRDVQRLRQKTSIPVAEAALLLGVPDESETLEYGEVFIQVSEPHASGGVRRRVIKDCMVTVTKNPCLHPGDILRLRAVDCPSLQHVSDCVVFPVKGPRPHPDESSGSDLDGDLYFCTWHPDLVPEGSREPMDFTSTPSPDAPQDPVSLTDMRDYFARSVTVTSLGVIANAHRVHADLRGADSDECLQLAKLHSDAVDAPKTGQPVEVPRHLVPETYPAWMEKEDGHKDTSNADTLLQRLHDQCPRVVETTETEVPMDPRFVLAGHEHFLDEARRLRGDYCVQLLQLMRRYRIKWEAEVFTGTFEGGSGSPKLRRQLEKMVQESQEALARHYRELFFQGGAVHCLLPEKADWTQLKASAWYVATYTSPHFRGVRMLSFAWIVADSLITIPQAVGVQQLGATGMLFLSLAESIHDVYRSEVGSRADAAWRAADKVAQCLRGIPPGQVTVHPARLEGLGLLSCSHGEVTITLDIEASSHVCSSAAAAALRRSFPRVAECEDGSVLRVMSSGELPELRLVFNKPGSDTLFRRCLCGWLQRFPELAPVCFVLSRWTLNQRGGWPLDELDICSLLLQQQSEQQQQESDEAEDDETQATDPFAWFTDWPPAAVAQHLERKPWTGGAGRHPGQVLHGFFEWMLARTRQGTLAVLPLPRGGSPRKELQRGTAELQDVRTGLLRCYQQICLDRHVTSLIRGTASPHLRTALFTIPGLRGDAPVDRIEEQLLSLGRGDVRVWLEEATARPAIKVEAKGTRTELEAVGALVGELRSRLRANAQLRLLTHWKGQLLVDQHKQEVLEQLRSHRVIIVCASTGSGKSTGIPKMMLEDENVLGPKRIICTQPRRIAATSLARRVAELCVTELGDEVGYRIGGAAEVRRGRTRLVYETTAIAMQQFLQGPNSVPCTHLIVDEVHNRTVFDDILLAVLKHHTFQLDKQMKVILMSAATDCSKLARYFTDEHGQPAPTLQIQGSAFPVDVQYLDDVDLSRGQSSAFPMASADQMAQTVWSLHKSYPPKSKFLVFLAGKGDIKRVAEQLHDVQDDTGGESLEIKSLHSGIPVEKQQQILEASDRNLRTVILATDIVESSVTIPDVDVVVDCCVHKRRCWNESKHEYELKEQFISRDEALQRAGRTGRLGRGTVYRQIHRSDFDRLPEHTVAQMETASISDLLLMLAESPAVDDPRTFLHTRVLSPPDSRRVDDAYMRLVELGAVDENRFVPTLFGRMLQRLPLDPELGLLVWNGLRFGALEDCEILTGVAQRGSPFLQDADFSPEEVRRVVNMRQACCPDSDLIASLRAYEAWQKFLRREPTPSPAEEAAWCWGHFLSLNVLQEIEEVRLQVHAAVAELGWAAKLPEEAPRAAARRRTLHLHLQGTSKGGGKAAQLPDPASGLIDMVGRYDKQGRRHRLDRWCVALAFLPNVVELSGLPSTQLNYRCRRREATRLPHFLRHQLGLELAGFPAPQTQGDTLVSFASPQEAQRAAQMGSMATGRAFPYRGPPRTPGHPKIKSLRCYSSSQVVLGSDSVCMPVADLPTAMVAASVVLVEGRNDAHFMCSKLTAIPTGLLAPLIALRANATLSGSECEVVLRGERESDVIDERCLRDVKHLRNIHMQSSLAGRVPSPQQVQEASEAALRIMQAVEEASQAVRSAPTVCVTLDDVPRNLHGRLIGKGGSNIKALKAQHPEVNIVVPKPTEGGHIHVKGSEEAVRQACAAIRDNLGLGFGAARARPSASSGLDFGNLEHDLAEVLRGGALRDLFR